MILQFGTFRYLQDKVSVLPAIKSDTQSVYKRSLIYQNNVVSSIMTTSNQVDLIGKPFDPAGLIAYQGGAVVSRTIVFQKSGTITLFAFDTGEGLSEHTAPFDAVVQVLDGEVEITISGVMSHLVQGQMIIMPANQPHALKALTKFKMMLTMIHT